MLGDFSNESYTCTFLTGCQRRVDQSSSGAWSWSRTWPTGGILSRRGTSCTSKLPRKLLRKAVGVPGTVHRACPLPSHKSPGRGAVGGCGHHPQGGHLSGLEIPGLIGRIDLILVLRSGFLKLLFWVFASLLVLSIALPKRMQISEVTGCRFQKSSPSHNRKTRSKGHCCLLF